MTKRKFFNINPADALLRGKTSPNIVVIGPTASGKSTLVYLLVNHKIIGFLSVGVGDKSQTTIIPCNFIFDERIECETHFALRVKKRAFDRKEVHIVLLEALSKLFNANSCDPEDTVDAMDDEWFDALLEPESATYHLRKISDTISFDDLKKALKFILDSIDADDFNRRVLTRKKELQSQKIKIADIRYLVFEQMWDELSDNQKRPYYKWLSSLESAVQNKLITVIGEKAFNDGQVLELSVDTGDIYEEGTSILGDLFDPYMPFSLIIDEITLACRPRMEMVELSGSNMEGQPLRFCLRDTMGMTQVSMDPADIRASLDTALNCKPDSILFLLSLEERDDVLKECCDALAERIAKTNKLHVNVYLLFTKPDRILENIINKKNIGAIELTQEDYNKCIKDAIESMRRNIKLYSANWIERNVSWASLRYREEKIDPIQIALKGEDVAKNFKPEGLFQMMSNAINETLKSILPEGMKKPQFVTAKDANKPAISIKVDSLLIKDSIINQLIHTLTQEKEVVNGYIISNKTPRLSGRSVSTYWHKLQRGLGHTTNARVYGNFSINMKGMLFKVISTAVSDFKTLYESGAVSTLADNLSDEELDSLAKVMDVEGKYRSIVFGEVNPALLNGWSERKKNIQILHLVFREYFSDNGRYYSVIDKLAYQISFANPDVKNTLEEIYSSPNSYDDNMRHMQNAFHSIIFEDFFETLFVEEMSRIMTEQINKMFITI